MTTIVCLRQDNRLWMGADSRAGYSNGVAQSELAAGIDDKVFLKDDILFGVGGTSPFAIPAVLRTTTFPKRKPGQHVGDYVNLTLAGVIRDGCGKNNIYQDGTKIAAIILIGIDGYIFEMNYLYCAHSSEDAFMTIGSGGDVASGSLYTSKKWTDPKKRIRCALEAASRYNAFTSGHTTIIEGPEIIK